MTTRQTFGKELQAYFSSPGKALFILIILVNFFVYLGSFTHIFRHDDWNYWYCTSGRNFDLKYIFDFYSFDRYSDDILLSVGFRPLALIFLGFQKLLFGSNYVLFHIFTFVLHVAILYALLKILLEMEKRLFAYFVVLLFSIYCAVFDFVIWPNNNFYMLQLLLMLVSIYLAMRHKKASLMRGYFFPIIILMQFPIVLLNEVGLIFTVALSVFMIAGSEKRPVAKADYYKYFYFLLPILTFVVLYILHKLYGYKFFVKLPYSTFLNPSVLSVALVSTVYAIGKFLKLIFFPGGFFVFYWDTAWFEFITLKLRPHDILLGFTTLGLFLGMLSLKNIRERKAVILLAGTIALAFLYSASVSRGIVMSLPPEPYPMLSMVAFTYVGSVSRFAYIFGLFFLIVIYAAVDTKRLTPVLKLAGAVALAVLIFTHGAVARTEVNRISSILLPLKLYFDQIGDFANEHKKEKDFSFTVENLPPRIYFADWWGKAYQYIVEGHFWKYLNHKDPKYILEYDYKKQKFSVYIRVSSVDTK